jgi:hypothetical protein
VLGEQPYLLSLCVFSMHHACVLMFSSALLVCCVGVPCIVSHRVDVYMNSLTYNPDDSTFSATVQYAVTSSLRRRETSTYLLSANTSCIETVSRTSALMTSSAPLVDVLSPICVQLGKHWIPLLWPRDRILRTLRSKQDV